MKFKVGDKVRVIDGLKPCARYGDLYITPEMYDSKGKIFTITSAEPFYGDARYIINDDSGYYYNDDVLEPVEEKENEMEKMVIIRDGSKVTAKYYKGDKTVSAEAKCSPEDEFDFEIGAKLAMDRAIEKMKKEDEVDYSWLKCVGYRQNYEFYFTVDKVYKIYDDGRITNDNDFTYGGKAPYLNSKEKVMELLNLYYIFEEVQN